ncbi:hypothetical protein SAMN02787118_11856 [Streptomyces mirabilis]|uniref:Uncharacterized protein n=1 Tax=Streptomyces mirabilis TaxID=68239 RepID=A0A1I2QQT5_9ACTN|nr:hypothetical protein SAMN02787118_11856 [Streptomyces mirabilis]
MGGEKRLDERRNGAGRRVGEQGGTDLQRERQVATKLDQGMGLVLFMGDPRVIFSAGLKQDSSNEFD